MSIIFISPPVGPTGEYPQGKLDSEDKGAINIAVGIREGKVCMTFGTPVEWIGFGATEALELANVLRKRADELEKQS